MKIAIKRGGKTRAAADPSAVRAQQASVGSAVLEAPEETHAPEWERSTPWPGGGPAPAGALQRGFGGPQDDASARADADSHLDSHEEEYIPRRGGGRTSLRALSRSVGGRVVLGVAVAMVLGVVALVVAGARSFLLHDDRFLLTSTSQIEITGNVHLSREDLLSVFAGDLERNIFRVSLTERRADLERLPWVEHATVMRLLPNRLRVAITERTPVALVRQGQQIGLVDANGVLLDMPLESAGDPHYTFPVLTGVTAADTPEARRTRMQLYGRFMQSIDSAGEHLSEQVSEIDMSDPEDVKALVTTDGADVLVHFGQQHFLERFHDFRQHLPEWRQQYPKLAAADMRYDGQVVLEMQKGQPAPLAGTDGGAATPTPQPVASTPTATTPAKAAVTAPAKSAVKSAAKAPAKPASKAPVKARPRAKAVATSAAAKRAAAKKAAAKKMAAKKAAHATGGTR